MGSFSLVHWLILGVVILLLFGRGRFSDMMSDVASGLKSFRKGLADDETPSGTPDAQSKQVSPRQIEGQAKDSTPPAAAESKDKATRD